MRKWLDGEAFATFARNVGELAEPAGIEAPGKQFPGAFRISSPLISPELPPTSVFRAAKSSLGKPVPEELGSVGAGRDLGVYCRSRG